MRIDLEQQYSNADDSPAIEHLTQKPVTLRTILIQAMLQEGASNEEKIKRYSLYRDLKRTMLPFIVLTVEDIAFLKKAVLPFSTLVVGQTHEMLEREYAPSTLAGPPTADDLAKQDYNLQ